MPTVPAVVVGFHDFLKWVPRGRFKISKSEHVQWLNVTYDMMMVISQEVIKKTGAVIGIYPVQSALIKRGLLESPSI